MILDNLSSHKSDKARELIQARGAKLVFLPPYSPDLNPIEMAILLKTLLQHVAERTMPNLWDKIATSTPSLPRSAPTIRTRAGYGAA